MTRRLYRVALPGEHAIAPQATMGTRRVSGGPHSPSAHLRRSCSRRAAVCWRAGLQRSCSEHDSARPASMAQDASDGLERNANRRCVAGMPRDVRRHGWRLGSQGRSGRASPIVRLLRAVAANVGVPADVLIAGMSADAKNKVQHKRLRYPGLGLQTRSAPHPPAARAAAFGGARGLRAWPGSYPRAE